MRRGDGLYCFHWESKSDMTIGMKIPSLILDTGGGWHKNLCAEVYASPDPVMTTISLPMPMASKRISKSPPHSVGCRICNCLSSHCCSDNPSSVCTSGYFACKLVPTSAVVG